MLLELLVTDDDAAGPAVPQAGLDHSGLRLEGGQGGGQAVCVAHRVRVDPVTVIGVEDQHVSDL